MFLQQLLCGRDDKISNLVVNFDINNFLTQKLPKNVTKIKLKFREKGFLKILQKKKILSENVRLRSHHEIFAKVIKGKIGNPISKTEYLKKILLGTDRLCNVVKLNIQCWRQIL